VKILIVDDEGPARDRLRRLLADSDEYVVVGDAANGHQALGKAAALDPDVVLLDIRMPGMGGLETARHLNELDNPPAVIFTTAYDEYAMAAFDAHAVGYILKPVRRQRLIQALQHAARMSATMLATVTEKSGMGKQRTQLCARVRGELVLIPMEDVRYFHSDRKYTRVCYSGGEHLIDDSLKQLEQEFSDDFVRIHRSALVAVARIEALKKSEDGQITVSLRGGGEADDDQLIISRRHVADVRRRLRGTPD